ncbi:hypothetical protein AMS68_000989 [Peltaster fructicola]|uniref:SnoaL-like domain-containing protein n=1 Tax=Peltaster fructicola TaxID=286661 RepID=A0A6H0XL49_9PEZI|nr:hypothetical protein AMS68_000989 [Peltaster fructicola]
MSQYAASVPADGSVSPAIQKFFESFYRTSDTGEAHEAYAEHFTKDGTLVMIADEVKGHSAIVQKRHAMWASVSSRSHKPTRIFAFGPGSEDVMLYGTVDYSLKDGKKASGVEWAARAHFVEQNGELKMDFYQVYLDSASMAAKAK